MASFILGGSGEARRPLTAQEIFQKVEQENVRRAAELVSYSSVRHYSAFPQGKLQDAEMVVSFHFAAPGRKTFDVVSEKGVGRIHKRVFRGLIDAEVEASGSKQKTDSSISSANYEVRLLGEERLQGRDSYVLELKPKRENKFLLRGKIWVDQQDFAIAKLEGDPMKSPSFWITRAHVVREYQKVGQFWIPRSDETLCHVRLAGDYILRINYGEYTVNGQNLVCADCALSSK